MKCPFCDSVHVHKNGFDDTSMDIWRCLACGETITQVDIDIVESSAPDDDDEQSDDEDDPELRAYLIEELFIRVYPRERPDRGG